MRVVKMFVVVALALFSGAALAGYKSTGSVVVNYTSRDAYGAFSPARYSSNNVEYSNSPQFQLVATLVAGLNSSSFVEFYWDVNENCTYIRVLNGSYDLP